MRCVTVTAGVGATGSFAGSAPRAWLSTRFLAWVPAQVSAGVLTRVAA